MPIVVWRFQRRELPESSVYIAWYVPHGSAHMQSPTTATHHPGLSFCFRAWRRRDCASVVLERSRRAAVRSMTPLAGASVAAFGCVGKLLGAYIFNLVLWLE